MLDGIPVTVIQVPWTLTLCTTRGTMTGHPYTRLFSIVFCMIVLFFSVLVAWWSQSGTGDAHEAPVATSISELDDYASLLDRQCSEAKTCKNLEKYGDSNVSYGMSRGFFPEGCRWREVFIEGSPNAMEYWNTDDGVWEVERPASCELKVDILSHSEH